MVPTLAATLGVKGRRPLVGTRDGNDLLYVFGVVNRTTAAVHAYTLESPPNATNETGMSKTRRMPPAFAAHRRHVGRMYPRPEYPRVVRSIDNAPWHRGRPIDEAMRDHPRPEFTRLPSYSPPLNPIERSGKKLRRRTTHNRLFDARADRKASIRASLCYFQAVRDKIKSLIEGRPKRKSNK